MRNGIGIHLVDSVLIEEEGGILTLDASNLMFGDVAYFLGNGYYSSVKRRDESGIGSEKEE